MIHNLTYIKNIPLYYNILLLDNYTRKISRLLKYPLETIHFFSERHLSFGVSWKVFNIVLTTCLLLDQFPKIPLQMATKFSNCNLII